LPAPPGGRGHRVDGVDGRVRPVPRRHRSLARPGAVVLRRLRGVLRAVHVAHVALLRPTGRTAPVLTGRSRPAPPRPRPREPEELSCPHSTSAPPATPPTPCCAWAAACGGGGCRTTCGRCS